MPFIDFAALKEALTIEQVVTILGIQMNLVGNQLRSSCPACKTTGGRELVVTPSKGAFYCFAEKKGGDLIALAAHIRSEPVKDAAVFLAGTVTSATNTSTSKVATSMPAPAPAAAPQPAPAAETDNRLEKVAARLLHEHPEVQALGLTPEKAEELGIGYDKRGVLRGRVLFPLYEDGELAGFMGFAKDLEPLIKFPSQLTEAPTTNVVPLHKAG